MKHASTRQLCFCCGRPIQADREVEVACDDDQRPVVGKDCAAQGEATGRLGLQPSRGGPHVWRHKEWTPSWQQQAAMTQRQIESNGVSHG